MKGFELGRWIFGVWLEIVCCVVALMMVGRPQSGDDDDGYFRSARFVVGDGDYVGLKLLLLPLLQLHAKEVADCHHLLR